MVTCVCLHLRAHTRLCMHTRIHIHTCKFSKYAHMHAYIAKRCRTLQCIVNITMVESCCTHCVALRYTHASIHPSMPTSIHYIACITLSKIIQSTEPNITIHVSTTHCSPLHECISLSPLGRSVCSRPMKMPPAALQCKPIACNCLKILAYL